MNNCVIKKAKISVQIFEETFMKCTKPQYYSIGFWLFFENLAKTFFLISQFEIFFSKNPILRSVRDVYLDAMLDDVSPEEEEMLGIQKSSSYAGSGGEAPKVDEKVPFNRDERVIKVRHFLLS